MNSRPIPISRWLALPLIGWLALLVALPAQAADEYSIDAVHSAVKFKVRHLFAYTSGGFKDFGGTLLYDAEHPERSSISLTIQAASIDTDNEKRDDHLRSTDFLAVEEFPTITFQSSKIEPTEKPNQYRATGDFTLRGVTRSITVDVEWIGFGEVPGMGTRGGFLATTTINRHDYGVKWSKVVEVGGAVVGKDVMIEVPLEVVRM